MPFLAHTIHRKCHIQWLDTLKVEELHIHQLTTLEERKDILFPLFGAVCRAVSKFSVFSYEV